MASTLFSKNEVLHLSFEELIGGFDDQVVRICRLLGIHYVELQLGTSKMPPIQGIEGLGDLEMLRASVLAFETRAAIAAATIRDEGAAPHLQQQAPQER